jgi:hypothetical protein
VTTRVALLDLPPLLADVVLDVFAQQEDLEVAVLPPGSGPQSIRARHPDVALIGTGDPEHYGAAEGLLRQRPELGLLAISLDGRQAWIHELRVQSRQLEHVSADSLCAAVANVSAARRP